MKTLIAGIILSIFSGVMSLVEKWKPKGESHRRKTNIIALIAFGLILLGAYLTFDSGSASIQEKIKSDSLIAKKDIENKKLEDSLVQTQGVLINLGLNQLDTAKLILRYNHSLDSAQNVFNIEQTKNSELQSELYNQVTGGNSIPHIVPMSYNQNNVVDFMILNMGRYAIQDVSLSMVDTYGLKMDVGDLNDALKVQNNISNHEYSVDFGTILPNTSRVGFYSRIVPQSWDSLFYTISISWRTGSYIWYINYKRNKRGEFRVATSNYTFLKKPKGGKF